MVLSNRPALAVEPCDVNDAGCLARALYEQVETGRLLGQKLKIMEEIVEVKKAQLTAVLENSALLDSALKEARKLAARAWYESPWLWMAVGLVIGGSLVVVSAWAIGQVANYGTR